MKSPRVFARGSEPPADGAPEQRRVVRTRAAAAIVGKSQRVATNTIIVDVSTPAHTKPTREVQHARNLFAMLDPDPDPAPVVAMTRTVSYPEIEIISMARREAHRTRRMQVLEDATIDETSIEVAPRASTIAHSTIARAAAKRDYRRGMFMGAAIATVIAASLAATFALLV